MSSLSSTAEEILALFDKARVHPDGDLDRIILKTDIENILHQYYKFRRGVSANTDFGLHTLILTNRS